MLLIKAKNHRYENCIEIECKLMLLRNKKSLTCLIRVLFLSIYPIFEEGYLVLKIHFLLSLSYHLPGFPRECIL